jgi:hypothetical protein
MLLKTDGGERAHRRVCVISSVAIQHGAFLWMGMVRLVRVQDQKG